MCDEGVFSSSEDLKELMRERSKFISRYQWIWDVQMTKFFQQKYWNNIPTEWWAPLLQMNTEQLNQLPFGVIEEAWPHSLKMFVSTCEGVSLARSVPQWVAAQAVPVGGACRRKMTPKKVHEVSRMAGVVADLCRRTNCSLVLDIGSGLGYLGEVLREECGLRVVGIEREGERVATARQRVSSSVSMATSVQLSISDTEESKAMLKSLLRDLECESDGEMRVCAVGLHCCGDLTPDLLRMVSGQVNPDLCALVMVGCCYHKMSLRAGGGGFRCFPISAHLLESSPELCGKMNVFGMRLACQETRARWREQSAEDHTHHGRCVSYRAMLQAVLPGQGRLKFGKSPGIFPEFAKITAKHLGIPGLERDLVDYHSSHHHFISLIEPFTALQVCMQGAMEGLVLADRLSFLIEQGLSPSLLPLFDDLVSPRNIAIVTTLPGAKIHLKQ